MKKHNRKKHSRQGKSSRFSARASLIAMGQLVRQLKRFDIIKQQVSISQKVVKHSPVEKLLDIFISILAGAKGLCEVNKRVRPDKMLQLAFGRTQCAEQSTLSQTLNAVTQENIAQMSQSLQTLYRQHGHGFRHDSDKRPQILDADLSDMPCGKKAELASKGYFAKEKNKRGRQMGRVMATRYREVVTISFTMEKPN
ncbi:transposase [Candidatus Poribacteria bacterium]|nr:transposase [Candidatus Poribacteria bacterium]